VTDSLPDEDLPSTILEVQGLRVWFPIVRGLLRRRVGWAKAVDGVTFQLDRGRTVGIVGESGSGKTTIARTVVRVQEPTEGVVRLGNLDLTSLRGDSLRRQRRRIQMIFQDSYASLDPRQTVGSMLEEALRTHGLSSGREHSRVRELLDSVGLGVDHAGRFAHELSGGQRQRVGIARSLAVEPDVIVCDEPLSALDVSIQSQIVNLLTELQRRLGLSYVFVSHDLAVVRQICDTVVVLYLGKIVEEAPTETLFRQPRHPYTIGLLSAVPTLNPQIERMRDPVVVTGDVPSPVDPPAGCRFHPRCWLREELGRPEICSSLEPVALAGQEHPVACHFPDEAEAGAHERGLTIAMGDKRPDLGTPNGFKSSEALGEAAQ
jgi:peptide/nickel transport system ATP-binding protein